MQVTEHIHSLEIPFQIPLAPDKAISRSVYVFLVAGEKITLIDSGVAGAHQAIFSYINSIGRELSEIATLILSHAHPDHIGSAKYIRRTTGCRVLAHPLEKGWVEDTDKQKTERPVPGFDTLVEGPVHVDGLLDDGQTLDIDTAIPCRVIATPGHSSGSVSLFFNRERVLFSGDALPLPGDLPIYEDITVSLQSIRKLANLAKQADVLLSSWEQPILGQQAIEKRIAAGVAYLQKIHHSVVENHTRHSEQGLALCQRVVASLGLPPFAANPLVAKAFMSSLPAAGQANLFAM